MSTHQLSKQFSPDLRDLKVIHDHPSPSVNVLAVHGLAAHPVESWAASEGKWNWLQHQLVRIIPKARVWTFGYDSTWYGDKSVDTRLSEVVSKLLDAIDQNDLSRTRLIFVAHSFGGIVVSKALLIAENRYNEWAKNGKALNLFQSTDALLFFGTPFGGIHDLPGLAKNTLSHVDTDIFDTFRRGNENLNQLKKDILDKMHTYKKPNAGCFQELQVANVGKIIGDERIPKVILVRREDAILADGPSSGEPRFLNRPLERNHFDMQKFGETDRAFLTVEFVLQCIVPKDLLHESVPSPLTPVPSPLTPVPSPLTPDDQAFLKSLSFPEMNDRFREIIKPSSDTCAWLLKHQTYQAWLKQQTDLLCIKGKPGAGKSTLIKFAVEEETCQRRVVASFFFHAPGTQMQKTSLGLYRSLLHQLLLQITFLRPHFRRLYQNKIQAHKICTWHVNELQHMLTHLIRKAGKIVPIFIYIDALDECGPEEERNLTDYLQNLTDLENSPADVSTKICFSCRHYPNINLHNCLKICAEKENKDDIAAHIKTVFDTKYLKNARYTDIVVIEEIRIDILKRSSNVFQWVFLVLKIIDNMYVKREPWKLIQRKTREVPKGLTDIYTHILLSIDKEDRPQSSILLRWVHLAKVRLTSNDLRIAMAFDTDTPHNSLKSWRRSDEYYGNWPQWKERITHLSGGLVEVVRRKALSVWEETELLIVQFIHESVNDYLQKGGISMLGIKQAGSAIGQYHKQIARSCVYYMKCPELLSDEGIMDTEDEDKDRWSTEADDENEDAAAKRDEFFEEETIQDDEKFSKYAINNWIWHAEEAEKERCSLADILVWFDYPSSKFLQQYLHLIETYGLGEINPGSTYLHLASSANLLSLADVLLTRDQVDFNIRDSWGETALYVASARGKARMVELLLKNGADVNAEGGFYGNALQAAAHFGYVAVVDLLLKYGANVHACGGYYGNMLRAANSGPIEQGRRQAVIELLLQAGAGSPEPEGM